MEAGDRSWDKHVRMPVERDGEGSNASADKPETGGGTAAAAAAAALIRGVTTQVPQPIAELMFLRE
jgi:hypothetical protein